MTDGPILLVEDSATDVLLVKRALARANVTRPLHVVTDGDQAVNYLSGAAPFDNRQAHAFRLCCSST